MLDLVDTVDAVDYFRHAHSAVTLFECRVRLNFTASTLSTVSIANVFQNRLLLTSISVL